MNTQHVIDVRENGYAVIRGFLNKDEVADLRRESEAVYAEGLKHHATYRNKNLYFEVVNDPGNITRTVPQAHWFSWINPAFEQYRRSQKIFEVLAPLLGPDIKQIANQLHWKASGGKYTYYRMHQDVRFRTRPELFANLDRYSLNLGLALNRQDASNGALKVVPGHHKRGYLGLAEDGDGIMVGSTEQGAELKATGIDPSEVVQLEMEPGDLAIWTLYTIHGSGPNVSNEPRILLIDNYVRAEDSPERGEWAFRDGRSVPLGDEPEICKYEALRENPGPFYVEERWTDEAKASQQVAS
ncbi:phytanoyl-CoA dioxygenase family protein [Neoaquamicrobium sediminum]|uniref:Phytanoyl-CoA dioxygenase family protein n=1 Tax=Neoaquamicrobium sediminum TaxID=1849104 RepID=A0ABV3X198_9HYPH